MKLSPWLCLALLSSCTATKAPLVAPALDADPASCAPCHAEAVDEWRQSQHAAAYSNGIFQSEFNPLRHAWCVSCHAPLAPDPTDVDDQAPLITQGVSCAACHFPKGELISRQKLASSPHQTRVDPQFGAPSFCASCHEFNFPVLGKKGVLIRYTEHPMQQTVSQYQQSGRATSMSCLDCHAATPGKHRYPGSHQLETLQSTLKADACLKGPNIELRLTNKEAAHNVPSGGVHRYMVLRAWRSSSPEKLFEAYLGRKFKVVEDGGKETISDTTLKPDEERLYTIDTDSLGARHEPVNLELRYIYALDEQDQFPDIPTTGLVWELRAPTEDLPRCTQ